VLALAGGAFSDCLGCGPAASPRCSVAAMQIAAMQIAAMLPEGGELLGLHEGRELKVRLYRIWIDEPGWALRQEHLCIDHAVAELQEARAPPSERVARR
jgi:hypothetical protein